MRAKERTISFCNYDGNIGISKTVNAYESLEQEFRAGGHQQAEEKTIIEETSGTLEKPLSVSDWIKLGTLGELP
ncbi:MAG: hypothetical protein COA52_02350 [Hyphomicrobiales bacterium]|nr:MAG: hypothetical protein COA52_02350 [Hyphomicrobiales bacterium]